MPSLTSDDVKDFLDKFLPYLPDGSALVATVIAPGLPAPGFAYQGFGTVPVSSSQSPLTTAPQFYNIGSVSKTFTASMLAQFQNANPGDWNSISSYLSNWNFPGGIGDIPLIDLAQYASGFDSDDGSRWIPFGKNDNLVPMQDVSQLVTALENYLEDTPPGPTARKLPQNGFGQYYTYSNLAFGLLGLCVAGVSSTSDDGQAGVLFNNVLSDMLSQCNLSMKNTMVYQSLPTAQQDLMTGYQGSRQVTAALGTLTPMSPVYAGAGGITSTIDDMGQWLLFNMGHTVETCQEVPIMTQTTTFKGWSPPSSTDTREYYTGLGWHMQPADGNEPAWVFKDGAVSGHTAYMAFTAWAPTVNSPPSDPPPSDTGVVVLLNYRYDSKDTVVQGKDATVIGRELMERVLKLTGQSSAASGA